jgi:hypothetical protein
LIAPRRGPLPRLDRTSPQQPRLGRGKSAPAGLLCAPGGPPPGQASAPRLGCLPGRPPRPGWAGAPAGLPAPSPRSGQQPSPGWAGSGGSGLAGIPLLRASVCAISRLGQAGMPLAQAGIPLIRPDYIFGRPNYSSPGRDLLPPGHITRPASSTAHRASPGTPPGSDWHILHHRMLVLGRPLAQTSISLLS